MFVSFPGWEKTDSEGPFFFWKVECQLGSSMTLTYDVSGKKKKQWILEIVLETSESLIS